MVREKTIFITADNSGAKILKCIKVLKDKKNKTNLGKFIRVSLKSYKDRKKFKKRSVYNGMPSLVKSIVIRKDGLTVKGGSSRVLLFNDFYKFLGTRSRGLILKELKRNTFLFKAAPKVVKYHNLHI